MDEKPKTRSKWRSAMWIVINLWLFSAVAFSIGRAMGFWR